MGDSARGTTSLLRVWWRSRRRPAQRVWHFQMVHHGVWDYDLPAAPNLVDITVDGQRIQAVAQVTKQGFCYVFDRVTGTPVWPIEERPVPQSTVPGEKTAPTQPFPTKPLPFEQQGITPNDVMDFTPELHRVALRILHKHTYGPLYTPPTERGTITVPGVGGGASWSGAAVHPETGMLYVPSFTLPTTPESQKSRGQRGAVCLYRRRELWARRATGAAPGQATVWTDHGH